MSQSHRNNMTFPPPLMHRPSYMMDWPRLEIKKELSASSEQGKSVEIYPSDIWASVALYSGNVLI